ncbi:expressed unknown protein [Seminavis robusta]|uniref:Uncharacterized protein n=1 Tax=Seminavis robusta TaxID=568900 RepID=A0A9N8HBY3_9STRA|nr:expressed unknown protein [Seminavis robusta]|eukprot:Sro297_g110850.1 n/a (1238) ;mRNA; f:16552-20265
MAPKDKKKKKVTAFHKTPIDVAMAPPANDKFWSVVVEFMAKYGECPSDPSEFQKLLDDFLDYLRQNYEGDPPEFLLEAQENDDVLAVFADMCSRASTPIDELLHERNWKSAAGTDDAFWLPLARTILKRYLQAKCPDLVPALLEVDMHGCQGNIARFLYKVFLNDLVAKTNQISEEEWPENLEEELKDQPHQTQTKIIWHRFIPLIQKLIERYNIKEDGFLPLNFCSAIQEYVNEAKDKPDCVLIVRILKVARRPLEDLANDGSDPKISKKLLLPLLRAKYNRRRLDPDSVWTRFANAAMQHDLNKVPTTKKYHEILDNHIKEQTLLEGKQDQPVLQQRESGGRGKSTVNEPSNRHSRLPSLRQSVGEGKENTYEGRNNGGDADPGNSNASSQRRSRRLPRQAAEEGKEKASNARGNSSGDAKGGNKKQEAKGARSRRSPAAAARNECQPKETRPHPTTGGNTLAVTQSPTFVAPSATAGQPKETVRAGTGNEARHNKASHGGTLPLDKRQATEAHASPADNDDDSTTSDEQIFMSSDEEWEDEDHSGAGANTSQNQNKAQIARSKSSVTSSTRSSADEKADLPNKNLNPSQSTDDGQENTTKEAVESATAESPVPTEPATNTHIEARTMAPTEATYSDDDDVDAGFVNDDDHNNHKSNEASEKGGSKQATGKPGTTKRSTDCNGLQEEKKDESSVESATAHVGNFLRKAIDDAMQTLEQQLNDLKIKNHALMNEKEALEAAHASEKAIFKSQSAAQLQEKQDRIATLQNQVNTLQATQDRLEQQVNSLEKEKNNVLISQEAWKHRLLSGMSQEQQIAMKNENTKLRNENSNLVKAQEELNRKIASLVSEKESRESEEINNNRQGTSEIAVKGKLESVLQNNIKRLDEVKLTHTVQHSNGSNPTGPILTKCTPGEEKGALNACSNAVGTVVGSSDSGKGASVTINGAKKDEKATCVTSKLHHSTLAPAGGVEGEKRQLTAEEQSTTSAKCKSMEPKPATSSGPDANGSSNDATSSCTPTGPARTERDTDDVPTTPIPPSALLATVETYSSDEKTGDGADDGSYQPRARTSAVKPDPKEPGVAAIQEEARSTNSAAKPSPKEPDVAAPEGATAPPRATPHSVPPASKASDVAVAPEETRATLSSSMAEADDVVAAPKATPPGNLLANAEVNQTDGAGAGDNDGDQTITSKLVKKTAVELEEEHAPATPSPPAEANLEVHASLADLMAIQMAKLAKYGG